MMKQEKSCHVAPKNFDMNNSSTPLSIPVLIFVPFPTPLSSSRPMALSSSSGDHRPVVVMEVVASKRRLLIDALAVPVEITPPFPGSSFISFAL